MEYKGKLYGKVGKHYFPMMQTTEDFDLLENENKELKECLKLIINEIKFLPSNELLGLRIHENYYNVISFNLEILEKAKCILNKHEKN